MPRISVEAQRREQILDAAIAVVARKGYEATTIRDVAVGAGASTGTVNYYFANKDDVLASALVEVAERFRRRVDEALDGVDDPHERLRAHGRRLRPGHRRRPSRTRSCGRSSGCGRRAASSCASCTSGLYDDWRPRIAKIVRDGIARGGFREVDAGEWAGRTPR